MVRWSSGFAVAVIALGASALGQGAPAGPAARAQKAAGPIVPPGARPEKVFDGGLVLTEGSHRQFKHPRKAGRITVSGHPGDDMPKGTLASVLRQAGLKRGRS